MNTTRWGFVALTALTVCATSAQAAGDAAAGKVKAYTCMGCHGVPGYNNVYPEYHVPKLGGQNADYVAAALKEYRSGDRPHPTMPSVVLNPRAQRQGRENIPKLPLRRSSNLENDDWHLRPHPECKENRAPIST